MGSGVLSLGLRATSNGFWVGWLHLPLLAQPLHSLFSRLSFTHVHLEDIFAFNGFFCEAGSGSTTCRFSLGLLMQLTVLLGDYPVITESIEGLSFPSYDITFRSSPSELGCN